MIISYFPLTSLSVSSIGVCLMSKLNFPCLPPKITLSFKLKLTATYLLEISVTVLNISERRNYFKHLILPILIFFSWFSLFLKRKFIREVHYGKMKNDLKFGIVYHCIWILGAVYKLLTSEMRDIWNNKGLMSSNHGKVDCSERLQ